MRGTSRVYVSSAAFDLKFLCELAATRGGISNRRRLPTGGPLMRWYVSIGAVLVAGMLTASDVAGVAAPDMRHAVRSEDKAAVQVDVELVLAVDVSYSMDMDELAVQREGYAKAIVSKEFLQALKSLPNGKISVTYFEWAASSDQKIIIPWRLIDGPE